MVFIALLVEGGLAFGIAAGLATWSRRHFAPRTEVPALADVTD